VFGSVTRAPTGALCLVLFTNSCVRGSSLPLKKNRKQIKTLNPEAAQANASGSGGDTCTHNKRNDRTNMNTQLSLSALHQPDLLPDSLSLEHPFCVGHLVELLPGFGHVRLVEFQHCLLFFSFFPPLFSLQATLQFGPSQATWESLCPLEA
jgi:hypothetical protein